MSVDRLDIDVDLAANEATATLEVAIENLFDDDGDAHFFVDTTIDDDWLTNLRVGERAHTCSGYLKAALGEAKLSPGVAEEIERDGFVD